MSATGLRLAARLARREVRHRPWRTLLVALLVAVPVAGMTVAVVLVRTNQLTTLEEWRLSYGAADAARLDRVDADHGRGNRLPDPSVPPGSRVVSYQSDHRLVRTVAGRQVSAEITNLPVADPLVAGVVRVTGRVPERASEVLLSGHTARELGVGVGDVVDLDRPLDARATVVGLGEPASLVGSHLLVLHRDVPFPARRGQAPLWRHLVDLPEGLARPEVQAWAALSGHELAPGLDPRFPAALPLRQQSAPIRWSWLGGAVVLTVVGIVIASAFAAGARRQLTTLGQLAANGAPPRTLRLVLILQGTWTGALGALVGLALGAAALAALASRRDAFFGRHIASYDLQPGDLVPVVLLGVTAATVAAMIPARGASRLLVLAALSGRRPLATVHRSLTAAGVVTCVTGLGLMALAAVGAMRSLGVRQDAGPVWALTAIAGAMALLLGVCAAAPGYVSVLTPLASRLGGSWRLAARSLARQRSRTAAAVSAVCVAAALAVAMSANVRTAEASTSGWAHMPADRVLVSANSTAPNSGPGMRNAPITPPPRELVDRLRAALPGAEVRQLSSVALDRDRAWVAAVAEPALLDTYGFDLEVRRTLDQTGLVFLGNAAGREQGLIVHGPGRQPEWLLVPVVTVVDVTSGTSGLLQVLITPTRAAELGLQPEPDDVLLRMPHDLTAEQRTTVQAQYEEHLDERPAAPSTDSNPPPTTHVGYHRPNTNPKPFVLDAVYAAMALLFTLFVVASSLALSAAENRDERDVLSVIGASHRTIQRTSGAKAVVVTLLGVVLALPVGLLPVLILTHVVVTSPPFVFPWRVVGLLVVGVPLVAGVVTTSASALALRLRPVRISTMTFE